LQEKPQVKVEPLNFEDVGGVFLFMISGVILSWCFAGLTFLWNIRNKAIKHNVTTCLINLYDFIAKPIPILPEITCLADVLQRRDPGGVEVLSQMYQEEDH